MFVRMFCHLGNMPHNMRPSQYVQKHNFPTHTHTHTRTLIHILSYTYLSQRRLELADDTAPVWATAAAAASVGGAAERERGGAGRQAARGSRENREENRFLLFFCKCHFIWICLCFCFCPISRHFGHLGFCFSLVFPFSFFFSASPCAFVIFVAFP